jgi:hypothetical protein
MNLSDRLIEAYRVVEAAAAELDDGNEPSSGFTILAFAALNSEARRTSADFAATWAESYAASARQAMD